MQLNATIVWNGHAAGLSAQTCLCNSVLQTSFILPYVKKKKKKLEIQEMCKVLTVKPVFCDTLRHSQGPQCRLVDLEGAGQRSGVLKNESPVR